MGHRAEEVIVEPDSGVDRGRTGAIDAEGDGDRCLARRASDRNAPPVTRADLEIAEWRRHSGISVDRTCAASIKRSFSCGSRTVSLRYEASGWPAPNVRGTKPRVS